MYERTMRIRGIVIVGLAAVIAAIGLSFPLIAAYEVARGSWEPYEATGPTGGGVVICGCAAICLWCGRLCLRQARAGRPLADYALATPAFSAGRHRTVTLDKPNAAGDLEFHDDTREDYRPYAFTLGPSPFADADDAGSRNALLGIDGEGIQPVTSELAMGAYWKAESIARRNLNVLLLDSFLFAAEPEAISVFERRVNPDGPVDSGHRVWGDTQLSLDPTRCFKIPYRDVKDIRWTGRSVSLALVRGDVREGFELELADGSTILLALAGRAPNETGEEQRRHIAIALDRVVRRT